MRANHQRGVTLIELMVTISIIGIILALVAPSFKQVIEAERLRGVHNQIVTDLQFARSEALLRRIPVHVAVRAQTGSTGACYVIFADSNRNYPWSTACDCSQPAASRCSSANTTEIRTVQLERSIGIDLAAPVLLRHGFDSESGALLVQLGEGESPNFASRYAVDSSFDAARKYRAHIDYSGRVATCAPPGSTVGVSACPPP